jgi:hypothetical protein
MSWGFSSAESRDGFHTPPNARNQLHYKCYLFLSIKQSKILETSNTTSAPMSRRKAIWLCVAFVGVTSLSLFFGWEFVKRHPGLVLVFVGVFGETIADWAKETKFTKRLKNAFAIVLVIGLALEIPEAAHSDKEAALSTERAKAIETTNALLRSNVAALDKEVAETKIQLAKANERTALAESNSLALRKEVAQIDPLNLPIVSAIAQVSFLIPSTTSLRELKPKSDDEAEFRRFIARLRFKDPDTGDFPVLLECEQIRIREHTGWRFVSMDLNFESYTLGAHWRLDEQSRKWDGMSAMQFDRFKEAEIEIEGLPDKTEIAIGTCRITLNSTIERVFSIDSPSGKEKIVLRPIKRNSGGPGK